MARGIPIENARRAGQARLDEQESKRLLAGFGLEVPAGVAIEGTDDLQAALATLQPPLALKLLSPEVAHKSDIGGVRLGLRDEDDVRRALAEMPECDRYLLEEMAPEGVEMILGGVRHPRFGPLVMVGLGGLFVETMADVALRIAPIDEAEAVAMLSGLRGAALLEGARGRPALDKPALIEAMVKLGGTDGVLMAHADRISEVDVNPIIVGRRGACVADAMIELADTVSEAAVPPVADLSDLLRPRKVAVAGASASGVVHGNRYIRALRDYGYPGEILPIHPLAAEVEGLKAWPSLAEAPGPIDYAYVAVAADQAPGLLAAAGGNVAFAQVMASGFEDAAGGAQAELVASARAGGMRLLGPNCLGTHSPSGRLTYMPGAPPETGGIAVLSQSGGLSMDMLRLGARKGLAFRAVVTMGNAADLGPAELLPWFLEDPETTAIGLYLEDAPRGRRLFEILRAAGGRKPVVLLAGGLSRAGGRAAQSHTGALAGDARAWDALCIQTGTLGAESLAGFLDTLLLAEKLRPGDVPTARVVLFGNGGGAGVLAVDAMAREGLEVPRLDVPALREIDLPAGASLANPIDVPANVLARDGGALPRRILEAVFATDPPEALIVNLNMPVIMAYRDLDLLGPLMAAVEMATTGAHVLLVLRSDGTGEVEAAKARLRVRAGQRGLPVLDDIEGAARALAAVARREAFLAQRSP